MRCVLIDPYATRNVHRLDRLASSWTFDCVSRDDGPERLAAALANTDVVIAQGWDASVARYAPSLGLLQLPNAGTDWVDWAAVPSGCTVANVFEHEGPVAEFVIAALLEMCIGLRELDRSFRGGDWSLSHRSFGPTHRELAGLTLGIVGYGRIGQAVALRAHAFGMTIVAVSRTRPENAKVLAWSGDVHALDQMLPRCHFLVLCCPLNADTRNLMNARRLALLPQGAGLVNVGRGEIVEEHALFDSLRGGALGAAALDVWWRYPNKADPSPAPSRFPFDRLPNVLMTPHVAPWTEPMLARRWKVIADNLDRYSRGVPLLNVVKRV